MLSLRSVKTKTKERRKKKSVFFSVLILVGNLNTLCDCGISGLNVCLIYIIHELPPQHSCYSFYFKLLFFLYVFHFALFADGLWLWYISNIRCGQSVCAHSVYAPVTRSLLINISSDLLFLFRFFFCFFIFFFLFVSIYSFTCFIRLFTYVVDSLSRFDAQPIFCVCDKFLWNDFVVYHHDDKNFFYRSLRNTLCILNVGDWSATSSRLRSHTQST